jgi:hypothetical protein
MCRGGKSFVEVVSPVIGVPRDLTEPAPGVQLRTTGLGRIDDRGQLRLQPCGR